MAEIRQRALTYAEEKQTEQEIEADVAHIKDAFARLRDEAIGDQVCADNKIGKAATAATTTKS